MATLSKLLVRKSWGSDRYEQHQQIRDTHGRLWSRVCGSIPIAVDVLWDPADDFFHVNWSVPWLRPDRYVADLTNFPGRRSFSDDRSRHGWHVHYGGHLLDVRVL